MTKAKDLPHASNVRDNKGRLLVESVKAAG